VVSLADVFATMADIFNFDLPDSAAEDSFSMLPLWKNPDAEATRTELIHQSFDGSLAIRKGTYKLEMCSGSGGESFPPVGYKNPDMPEYQLYNLETDIGEKKNIIENQDEIVEELKQELAYIIHNGRSTKGEPQKNTGDKFWPAIAWTKEYVTYKRSE